MSNPLADALAIVQKARKDLKDTLKDTKYIHNILLFNGWLDKMEAKLVFMGANNTLAVQGKAKTSQRFQPMTSMMGRPITHKARLDTDAKKEVLNREQQQQQAYLKAVDQLWGKIGKLSPQSVLTNYGRNPNEQLVLRGVAKRAKLDFNQDLTIKFVAEIQEAIKKATAEAKTQTIIDKSVTKPKIGTILTAEIIEADPKWLEIGAVPGDTGLIDKKKNYSIIAKQKEDEYNDEQDDDKG